MELAKILEGKNVIGIKVDKDKINGTVLIKKP